MLCARSPRRQHITVLDFLSSPFARKRALINKTRERNARTWDFPMRLNPKIGILLVTVAAFIGLGRAQNSKLAPSSTASPRQDPLKTATKPLTPKSAAQPPRSSSVPLPNRTTNSSKNGAELNRLERESMDTGVAKGNKTGTVKTPSIKPAGTSSKSGSGINASYQKPHALQR
jgi:hypothetical protein